mgnify:CR=1 FL=1
MKKLYSKVEPDKLLHIIHKVDEFYTIEDGHRRDLVGDDSFIQLSAMNMKKGHTFRPHQHIWKPGEVECIAQESWVVIEGSVKVIMYDLDDTIIETPILYPGDCSMTFQGGHTYKILEEDTIAVSYTHLTLPTNREV